LIGWSREELDVDLGDIYRKIKCVLVPVAAMSGQRDAIRDSPGLSLTLSLISINQPLD
jgi:hypothetical protein